MENLLLSVVICTYNRDKLLTYCLKSLVDQTMDKRLYEVIIVDNNSTDSTSTVVKQFIESQPNFRTVLETKQGLSYARNRGWQEAKSPYVAYIDDDAKANPDWCERIVNAFLTVEPEPAAVGGRIFPWYEAEPPEWFTDSLEIRTWGSEAGFLKSVNAFYGFSGSNMAFPIEVIKKYSGFSPEFGMIGKKMQMGEETFLFVKIYSENPYFWYDPGIMVYHWVPIRNMTIRYRLRRNYLCGLSGGKIEETKIPLMRFIKMWVSFILRGSVKLMTIPWFSSDRKKFFVSVGGDLANHIGFLVGLVKKVTIKDS